MTTEFLHDYRVDTAWPSLYCFSPQSPAMWPNVLYSNMSADFRRLAHLKIESQKRIVLLFESG